MTTTLYLVRHAQAAPLRGQPEPEWALSARGTQQARDLVPVLTGLGIQHVYSSPFRRCRDTLRPFAAAAGIELLIHDGLRERCLSRSWIGDFRDVWTRSWADFSYALDGGESSFTCRDRMAATVGELARRHAGQTIALASHGYAIGLLLTTIDGRCGIAEASALRTPEILKLTCPDPARADAPLTWHREFSAGPAFDEIATDFRLTPGIVA